MARGSRVLPPTKSVRSASMPVKAKDEFGRVMFDKELVKDMFFQSDDYTFVAFVKRQGWDIHQALHAFPADDWTTQKQTILKRLNNGLLENHVYKMRYTFNRDIANTLKRYPRAIDKMMRLIEKRLHHYLVMADNDEKSGTNNFERTVDTKELYMLNRSLAECTDAKYKALCINNYNVETKIRELREENKEGGHSVAERQMMITVKGYGEVTEKQIRTMAERFYDKPQELEEPKQVSEQPSEPPQTIEEEGEA